MFLDFIENLFTRLFAYRFIRFGVVGASGTVVNLLALYLAQEFLFIKVASDDTRLNLSLAFSIFIATINNFFWNRIWTWRDRQKHHHRPVIIQFFQYGMACWVSIVIQFVLTRVMASELHYLVANLIAIVTASISNYFINDRWTFSPARYRLREIKTVIMGVGGGDQTLEHSSAVREPSNDHQPERSHLFAMNEKSLPHLALVISVILGVFTYFYALDSKNAPTNPSEGVYAHIARTTAESGHFLPLRSELVLMRNTKPPMLFWQGILSTHWGEQWDRFSLRYPSVLYTMATAFMIFLLGRSFTGHMRTGFLAVLTFLAFYNTYRFGRPFLTSAGEVFWFFLPFFSLLYWRERALESKWLVPTLFGLAIGIGLLYKSFVLLVPVGIALALWYGRYRDYDWHAWFRFDLLKLTLLAFISLGVFSLWFVLDPDPQSILKEFVVGENVGKMNPGDQSYLRRFLWGSQSALGQVISIFSNAGLMAPLVAGVMWVDFRKRKVLSDKERLLWILFLVFFVFFVIPSYRSGRYLLPVMPAMALLIAYRWSEIPRGFFLAALAVTGVVVSVITWLSLHLSHEASQTVSFGAFFWIVIGATLLVCMTGLLKSDWTRDLAPISGVLALLVLAGFLRLLDGPMGRFSDEATRMVQSQTEVLGVPCDFAAKDESYRFEFPAAKIWPYSQGGAVTKESLAKKFPLFVVDESAPDGNCKACKVIGQRFMVRGMQTSEEIKTSLRDGMLFPLLIGRQVLVDARAFGERKHLPEVKDCR